jgi:hypothetical protein
VRFPTIEEVMGAAVRMMAGGGAARQRWSYLDRGQRTGLEGVEPLGGGKAHGEEEDIT